MYMELHNGHTGKVLRGFSDATRVRCHLDLRAGGLRDVPARG